MKHHKADAFGDYIKDLREQRGLSVRGLAAKAGTNHGVISRIESGARKPPKAPTLKALAQALDVPATDLFAAAGFVTSHDLPDVKTYLRTRYGHLPEEKLTVIDNYIKRLIDEHGMDPRGPREFEDETNESSQQ